MVFRRPPSVILALNAGSSSLKFGLYRADDTKAEAIISGEVDAIGETTGNLTVRDDLGDVKMSQRSRFANQPDAAARVFQYLGENPGPQPEAIGHRIVHGGAGCREHCLINREILHQLEQAASLAPLHVPAALTGIQAALTEFPDIPQIACLDTAFHRTLPDVARRLPLPKPFRARGIERYGFHGLSCESIVRQIGPKLPEKLVIAHLGNGASVTAIKSGRSVDTSMGLTPAGGVVMGSRTGDLDPGVFLYLQRESGFSPPQLEDLLERKSGLGRIDIQDSQAV